MPYNRQIKEGMRLIQAHVVEIIASDKSLRWSFSGNYNTTRHILLHDNLIPDFSKQDYNIILFLNIKS